MPSVPLPNYLRSHRKRLGLSQDDLAYLLGCSSGAKISRYERFHRQPTLATVFACEVILHVPARQLFAGLYITTERDVVRRARVLLRRLASKGRGLQLQQRVSTLKAIVGISDDLPMGRT